MSKYLPSENGANAVSDLESELTLPMAKTGGVLYSDLLNLIFFCISDGLNRIVLD
jgi:hypothetical protein